MQKSSASVLCAAVGAELFCARDTHVATPQIPDSRQSFAADTVVGASAASSALQSFDSCVSQSVGALHLAPSDFASEQKSAAAGAEVLLELQPPRTTKTAAPRIRVNQTVAGAT